MNAFKIAGQAVALCCAVGVFYLIARILAEDVPMPAWMPFDLRKDLWLAPVLKVFGAILIAPPLVGLLVSLLLLGYAPRDRSLYDNTGPIELRLAPGAKYTGAGICLMIVGAILYSIYLQDEPWTVWLFAGPVVLAGLYGLVLCFVVRAIYDEREIASVYYALRWRRNDWSELTGIEHHPGPGDIVLRFGGRTQRLSVYYRGIDDLIAFANVKLKEAALARTA